MNINIESDVIESDEGNLTIQGTEVPVYQLLSDLASGTSIMDICEEYEIEESLVAQLLQDLSECFR